MTPACKPPRQSDDARATEEHLLHFLDHVQGDGHPNDLLLWAEDGTATSNTPTCVAAESAWGLRRRGLGGVLKQEQRLLHN
eukprot:CAMPEP_0183521516 /NCGR_PEP_ID=MMETSP0371-20130417/17732_1 /TAXON_ID=268820 /ORGANISM="Peridinium aciculiferum, Strain PAER-2" /LENGTH=80 /DNA_ID=CAMNT_0025720085 /DNA_START=186 /DNA_END=429 /DNA_ORIENTATION=-